MSELKPCPFCGDEEPVIIRLAGSFVCGCPTCEAEVRVDTNETSTTCKVQKCKIKCIELWNKRTESLELERLTAIKSDRESAVKLMSKSWRHIADTDSKLITRYVEMAERQFKAKDGEIERLAAIITQKATRCDELYEALEKVLDINAMPSELKSRVKMLVS
jgi:predicted RNase H-like nuclease (RuvC/YqgF family)